MNLPTANPVYPRRGRDQHVLRLAEGSLTVSRTRTSGRTILIPPPSWKNVNSIQQGYVTAEPYEIERQGHFKPDVFLLVRPWIYDLCDPDRDPPAPRRKESDLVQRFVSASIGWSTISTATIQGQRGDQEGQPRHSDEEIAFAMEGIKDYGVIDSGSVDDGYRRDDRRALEGFHRADGGMSAWSTAAPTTGPPTPCSWSTRASASISSRR